MFNYRNSFLFICNKSLLQTVDVIIRPPTSCSSSGQTSLCTNLLGAVEEKDALEVDLLSHLLIPNMEVLLAPGKPINQKIILVRVSHGLLQQRASDESWYQSSISKVLLYNFSKPRSWRRSLCSQQVSCR